MNLNLIQFGALTRHLASIRDHDRSLQNSDTHQLIKQTPCLPREHKPTGRAANNNSLDNKSH